MEINVHMYARHVLESITNLKITTQLVKNGIHKHYKVFKANFHWTPFTNQLKKSKNKKKSKNAHAN